MRYLRYMFVSACAVGAIAGPVVAQSDMEADASAEVEAEAAAEAGDKAEEAVEQTSVDATTTVATQAEAPPAPEPVCELHVWPTENYLGIQMGLLSGFGAIGALADMAAHDGRVATVKDLMREYLGPDIQMEELNRIGINKTLKLNDYAIIVEEPTPFNEELKENPELKAKTDAMNAKLKSGERLTDVSKPCYAELLITHVYYLKAMLYGSNLFTGFLFRDYTSGRASPKVSKGQVKNPLEEFPPKSAEMVETAKVELRDAFAKDFVEWSQKKLKK